jgi:hypothetical protein
LHRTRVARVPENFKPLVYLASGFVKKRVVASRSKKVGACVPKLLVVFSSVDSYAARIADAVARGANSVRFTEVDVRAVTEGSGASAANVDVSGRRRLVSFDALRDYDGVVLVGPGPESTGHELGALLHALEQGEPMVDTVFALAGEENMEMLAALGRSGGLIVSRPRAVDAEEGARLLGARVANVIGWVRHALAHQAEHGGGHHHHHSAE